MARLEWIGDPVAAPPHLPLAPASGCRGTVGVARGGPPRPQIRDDRTCLVGSGWKGYAPDHLACRVGEVEASSTSEPGHDLHLMLAITPRDQTSMPYSWYHGPPMSGRPPAGDGSSRQYTLKAQAMKAKADVVLDRAAFARMKRIMPAYLASRRRDPEGSTVRPLPDEIAFKLTNQCNLRCTHCYQWGDNGHHHDLDLRAQRQHLSFDIVAGVFAATRELGSNVYLWGGEPLMYRHWDKLADLLVRDPRWTTATLKGDPRVGIWTDDFHNVLSVFKW
jgi:hypothetical protein